MLRGGKCTADISLQQLSSTCRTMSKSGQIYMGRWMDSSSCQRKAVCIIGFVMWSDFKRTFGEHGLEQNRKRSIINHRHQISRIQSPKKQFVSSFCWCKRNPKLSRSVQAQCKVTIDGLQTVFLSYCRQNKDFTKTFYSFAVLQLQY